MQSKTTRVWDEDCPRGMDIAAYVEGEFRADELADAEAHFVECTQCRRSLAAYVQFYAATDLDDDDARLIEEVDARTRPLVREQIRTALDARSRRRWRSLAAAAAITIVGAITLVWLLRSQEPSDLEKGTRALDAVLAKSRPSQFRLAEAAYSPHHVARGGVESQVEIAEYWLRAAAAERPSAEAKRQLARVLILKGDAAGARALLAEARRDAPDDVDLAVDFAVARAEAGNLEAALEDLTSILQAHPDRADALFDRALVNARLRRVGDARADWERYFALDPSSPWADEGRRFLTDMISI